MALEGVAVSAAWAVWAVSADEEVVRLRQGASEAWEDVEDEVGEVVVLVLVVSSAVCFSFFL